MPDIAGAGEAIGFADGHLTDRRQSIRARKTAEYRSAPYALPASRWMVSWEATEPISAVFDLGGAYRLREFRLWFCDDLPEVTIEASVDGERWQVVGVAEAQAAGEDVLDARVPLAAPQACRYLRASFAAREAGRRLTLVEAEVWGDAPGE